MARLWLLTFALLVALVAAGPVKVEKRGAVSLPLRYGARKAIGRADIQRGKRSSPSSTIAQLRRQLARNKQMYGDGSVPAPFLRKRVTSGSLNLTDDGYDIGYHISVQVGTPPQTFDVDIGLGSADFWLASEACCSNTTITHKFNTYASTSWVNNSLAFQIIYLSGNVSGWIGSDTVSLGEFAIGGQTMGAADFISGSTYIADPLSGFMGFGWRALAVIPGYPWWQSLMSRGVLQEPLFGLYVARHLLEPEGGTNAPGGSLDLGFTNTAYYSGQITYTNLTAPTRRYWEVPVQYLTINGHVIKAGNSTAAIDAGTTLIIVPENVLRGLFDQVPGATPGKGDLEGLYVVPCNTSVTLSFTISGVEYPISAADWVFNIAPGVCVGVFQGADITSVTWVLGNAFLKNVYSVYRYDPPAVGFAQLSPAVRYAGTGKTVTSSIPLSTPSPTTTATTTTPTTTTTTFSSRPNPSTSHTSTLTTPRPPEGASCGGPALSVKVILSTCLSTLLWITLSHLL